MASLSSASSLQNVLDSYADNASYAEDNSVAKGRAFITACRIYLVKAPAEASQGGAMLRLSPQLVQDELARAQRWVAAAGSTNGGVHLSQFDNFRY